MVNIQAWFDKKYPKEGWKETWYDYDKKQVKEWRKISEVEQIHLTDPSLEGELDLGNFTYSSWNGYSYCGVKVLISPAVDETKLNFKNLPRWAKIIKLIQAQEYINQQYPTPESREQKTKLNIHYKLEGTLDLSDFINLKELECRHNKLTSLNISNCSQLEKIDCKDNSLTNLTLPTNSTNLKKLNLKYNNLPEQVKISMFGCCPKCLQINTSYKWCQSCADREWTQDLEQSTLEQSTKKGTTETITSWWREKVFKKPPKLIERFIKERPSDRFGDRSKLQWIPYEQFENIEHLADGGFSQIYKAKWGWGKKVVLKSLNNSQNITLDFLTEITNTKLVAVVYIVKCYGISQDPNTGNYLMVMKYMKDGNLRDYLKNEYSELSLERKLGKLGNIAFGLNVIHDQNLVHRDFHSGNILNNDLESYITDLGLSQPANYQKQEGQIFGVLPYVAPEVLQGQPYTQKSDIYSFGIIAYELLANAYPYYEPELKDLSEFKLSLKICQGLRPDIDKIPISQLLKDLIKKCWDADPQKRPRAEELNKIINGWQDEIRGKDVWGKDKERTQFYHQYQSLEQEYHTFSQNTPYQIHPTATLTSKPINTKQITRLLQGDSGLLDLKLDNLNLEDTQEQSSLQAQIEIPPK